MVINHCPVMLSLPKHLCVATALLLVLATASAQEFANIEYLCADWGPAMKLPTKEGEKPQFSDTEEEIYFLKQVGRFTRKKSVPDLFSGKTTRDVGRGISIYLCKMKPDGSAKTEIQELWKNPNYPIDTQAQSTWMDVHDRTRKIALSITFAGSDLTGLWTMNLDGSDLKQVIVPTLIDGKLQAIDSPSWTPDGNEIVFGESLRGDKRARIAKCDLTGRHLAYLTDGPADSQPRVSTERRILYVHDPMKKLGEDGGGEKWVASTLWLMDLDGTNKREIPNPEAKPSWPAKGVHGTYPAWSPDGRKIFAVSAGIIDPTTGRRLAYGKPVVQNWPSLEGKHANVVMPHWGRQGLLCSGWGQGIQLADEKLEKLWILASSDLEEVKR